MSPPLNEVRAYWAALYPSQPRIVARRAYWRAKVARTSIRKRSLVVTGNRPPAVASCCGAQRFARFAKMSVAMRRLLIVQSGAMMRKRPIC